MSYNDRIYNICSRVDLNDKDDMLEAMRHLANECVQNHRFMMILDTKLQEIMSAADYAAWSTEAARMEFMKDIVRMPDGDFKNTILENIDKITGSEDDFISLMEDLRNEI